MVDPIADMLTRIRNTQAVNKEIVDVPYSILKWNIAKVLEKEGLLRKVAKRGRKTKRTIEAEILYDKEGKPLISNLVRISKSSRRVYKRHDQLIPVKNNLGISIISTSKGLMTNKEARKKGLGGELMFKVW